MNMPGFAAERSLYTSSTHYTSTAMSFRSADVKIQPQMTMCNYLKRRLRELGPELGLAAAEQDWQTFTSSLQALENTLTAYRNGRC